MSRKILEVDSNIDEAKWQKCDEVEEALLRDDKGVLELFWVVSLKVGTGLLFGETHTNLFKERVSEEARDDD